MKPIHARKRSAIPPYLQAESHTGPHERNDIRILLQGYVADNDVFLHLPQDAMDPSAGEGGFFVVVAAAAEGRDVSAVAEIPDGPDLDFEGARVLEAKLAQYLALFVA